MGLPLPQKWYKDAHSGLGRARPYGGDGRGTASDALSSKRKTHDSKLAAPLLYTKICPLAAKH